MPSGSHIGRRGKPSVVTVILGVIGELLITAAVVVAGFAFWQLYWTTYEIEGPRQQVIATYSEQHKPVSTNLGEIHTEAPPEFTRELAADEVYGLLHVPTWDWMKIPLAESTSTTVLDQGFAGHYTDTAQAGQVGNFSVAGHRRTYGNNFRWIDRLKVDDSVVVELDDIYIVYKVQSNEIVSAADPDNIRVIAPVINDLSFAQVPTERWMTMTTCHPEYGNSERFIVHLKFSSWTPKRTGVPAELVDEPTN